MPRAPMQGWGPPRPSPHVVITLGTHGEEVVEEGDEPPCHVDRDRNWEEDCTGTRKVLMLAIRAARGSRSPRHWSGPTPTHHPTANFRDAQLCTSDVKACNRDGVTHSART